MDYQTYLHRINYQGETIPTLENLKKLHRQHYFQVPFENLDIHLKREIRLSPPAFYTKIVRERRGGFCYELNGLFYELLLHLGYQVQRISARVYDKNKGFGSEYDHMALLVKFEEEKWLVDVGFGEFIATPLKLELDEPQFDERGTFIISAHDDHYLAVKKITRQQEKLCYIFSTETQPLEAFEGMCHYHQNSPASHFTHQKICSLPLEDGRVSLSDRILKIAHSGEAVQEFSLSTDKASQEALLTHFGIRLATSTTAVY